MTKLLRKNCFDLLINKKTEINSYYCGTLWNN